MSKVLLIIDAQNDYLENGKFPLYNMPSTLKAIEDRVKVYQNDGGKIVLVKHVSPVGSPFFEKNSNGALIISTIQDSCKNAPVVEKEYGNSFDGTNLEKVLSDLHCTDLEICGMMTQNCVLFTAISNEAKKYNVTIYEKGCTTVSPVIHAVAIGGLKRITSVI
ncbi:MAG: isochorismatase family protein [Campylobacteraceae bacterium]